MYQCHAIEYLTGRLHSAAGLTRGWKQRCSGRLGEVSDSCCLLAALWFQEEAAAASLLLRQGHGGFEAGVGGCSELEPGLRLRRCRARRKELWRVGCLGDGITQGRAGKKEAHGLELRVERGR